MFTVQDIARRQSKEPRFVIEGATRSDIHQGRIGNSHDSVADFIQLMGRTKSGGGKVSQPCRGRWFRH